MENSEQRGGGFETLKIGNIEVDDFVVEKGEGYIRYNGSLQICWGRTDGDKGTQTITFPVPFASTDYCGGFAWYDTTSSAQVSFRTLAMNDRTTTSFTQYFTDNTYKSWFVIGKWK